MRIFISLIILIIFYELWLCFIINIIIGFIQSCYFTSSNYNKHFESSQKLWKDGIGKLYRKYAVNFYFENLVVNLNILLVYTVVSVMKLTSDWF